MTGADELFKSLCFLFTAAARAAPVGDIVLPKSGRTTVSASGCEAVVHVVDGGSGLELVLQSIRLLPEELPNPGSCLKSRKIARIKPSQLGFFDLKMSVKNS